MEGIEIRDRQRNGCVGPGRVVPACMAATESQPGPPGGEGGHEPAAGTGGTSRLVDITAGIPSRLVPAAGSCRLSGTYRDPALADLNSRARGLTVSCTASHVSLVPDTAAIITNLSPSSHKIHQISQIFG